MMNQGKQQLVKTVTIPLEEYEQLKHLKDEIMDKLRSDEYVCCYHSEPIVYVMKRDEVLMNLAVEVNLLARARYAAQRAIPKPPFRRRDRWVRLYKAITEIEEALEMKQ